MDPAVVTLLLLLPLFPPPPPNLHTKSLLIPSTAIASPVLPYVAYLYSHCFYHLGWGTCVGACTATTVQYSTVKYSSARGVSRGASQSLEGERARLIVISSAASFPPSLPLPSSSSSSSSFLAREKEKKQNIFLSLFFPRSFSWDVWVYCDKYLRDEEREGVSGSEREIAYA